VLCVDKTGTLTEDRIVYAHSIDVTGRFDDAVGEFAYLAVHFQEGPHNRLDDAMAELLAERHMDVIAEAAFTKVDEIAFDHTRRRTAVVVARQTGEHILISKGDPDVVLPRCTRARLGEETVHSATTPIRCRRTCRFLPRPRHARWLSRSNRPARFEHYTEADEDHLVLAGFVGFVDPVRGSAAAAVRSLADHGVKVKILTGDSKTVTRQVAAQVGIDGETIVVGRQIDRLTDMRLRALVARATVFAELTPAHKTRIVGALREGGHAVGFLGDGVNDVPALGSPMPGIAADTATDVAKHGQT
jgi:Mg2+-importing ATPase